MSDLANTYLGQYQLIEAIGQGGMATVYKAYQASLDRFVAVKVLHANRDQQFAVRFKREARAIATLQHHNILPIYDYGEQDGLLYFVLQYVENAATLHDLLGKPMAPGQALRLISHVLAALEYAHARGVIHRDLKPANILLPSPNWALLADFGIAKLMNENQNLTMSGFIIGTAAYMAPEQAAGRPVDARTDLYSLGVVLYEMLTGRVPFDSDTPMAVLTKHVYEAPPPPRQINPNIAPVLEAVLLRALAKDPDVRYQSAGEMLADVEQIAAQFERPRPPSQVTSLYQTGVEAFQRGDWPTAIEMLSRVEQLTPAFGDTPILLNAARVAYAQTTGSLPVTPAASQPQPAVPPLVQPMPPPGWPGGSPAGASAAGSGMAGPPGPPVTLVAQGGDDQPVRPARRFRPWMALIGALVLALLAGSLWLSGTLAAKPPATPTSAPTLPPAATAAPVDTPTNTATNTPTATATATATAMATPTPSPSSTPTDTPEPPTDTPVPPTNTRRPTPRPLPPTATPEPPPTATPEPPTNTPEPPPTETPTPTKKKDKETRIP